MHQLVKMPMAIFSVIMFSALAFPLTGCREAGPRLAPVSGNVTFGGSPLANARIEFQPRAGNPSSATTDASGHYELRYSSTTGGAVVGMHSVCITTAVSVTDDFGDEVQIIERLPSQYHSETTLQREVAPGPNTIDFELNP